KLPRHPSAEARRETLRRAVRALRLPGRLLGGTLAGVAAALLALALALLGGRLDLLAPGARHAGDAHAAGHLTHHLLRVEEPGEGVVALGDGDAGAGRDAGPPRTIDDLGVLPLVGRHRVDDAADPVEVAVVDLVDLLPHLPHARHHAQKVLDRA